MVQVVLPCTSAHRLLQRSKETEKVGCENCLCIATSMAAANSTRVDTAVIAKPGCICDMNNPFSFQKATPRIKEVLYVLCSIAMSALTVRDPEPGPGGPGGPGGP